MLYQAANEGVEGRGGEGRTMFEIEDTRKPKDMRYEDHCAHICM